MKRSERKRKKQEGLAESHGLEGAADKGPIKKEDLDKQRTETRIQGG